MQKADALWEGRAVHENIRKAIPIYTEILDKNPDCYEAAWKLARAYFFLGDLLPETKELKDRHREMGEKGMFYGKRALELNPEGIEGHYYYGLSLAQYSIGISIVKALLKGLGPEYERQIKKAIEINEAYNYAGPLRAMGRYWYRLPWPKRDLKKSIDYLERAANIAPMIIRGHVYLAETYLKKGKKDLAGSQLKEAIEMEPDLKIEPDALRWKEKAREILSKVGP